MDAYEINIAIIVVLVGALILALLSIRDYKRRIDSAHVTYWNLRNEYKVAYEWAKSDPNRWESFHIAVYGCKPLSGIFTNCKAVHNTEKPKHGAFSGEFTDIRYRYDIRSEHQSHDVNHPIASECISEQSQVGWCGP